MYTPKHFQIADVSACHRLIADHPFGQVISVEADGVPTASHLPFHLVPDEGEAGTLYAHMARANPQWRTFGDTPVRVIFSGPHAYVSPTWYSEGPAVPTWNYLAVHCVGVAQVVESRDELEQQMADLSMAYEAGGDWRFGDLPDSYRAGMLKGIVGFSIRIDRMIGKAKLSQNKPEAETLRLAAHLEKAGRAEDAAVAALMRQAAERE
ncbi:FMN-binding negative transcriptional regulator [Minwuia sp.]|uniref:FMN-binding negative transcriptional regulator n=1 Tax=Minwuia sp. TaxID=2493630 RepID=UPI003A8D9623